MTSENIFTILTTTYATILPILIGYAIFLLKKQKKERESSRKGIMLLLRMKIIDYHGKYTQLGEIPNYAYENFVEMCETYAVLGGNGLVTKMRDDIEDLHLQKKVKREG